MPKHHLVIAASLAAALAGCGSDDDGQTLLPRPKLENPAAYFGLETCTCYEYAPEKGGPERLGIAIESIERHAGAEHLVVSYLQNGRRVREDFFRPTDPDLLLSRTMIRTPAEGGGWENTVWLFDPALPFHQYPVESGKRVELESSRRVLGEEESQSTTFQANYVAQTVQASLDDGATEQSFDAVRVSFVDPLFSGDRRWFVPETGWVRLDLEIEGERTQWVLQRKFNMGDSCPWNYGDPPAFVCGVDEPADL